MTINSISELSSLGTITADSRQVQALAPSSNALLPIDRNILSEKEWFQYEIETSNRLLAEWKSGFAYSSPEAAKKWLNDLSQFQKDINGSSLKLIGGEKADINGQFDAVFNHQAQIYLDGAVATLSLDQFGQVNGYAPDRAYEKGQWMMIKATAQGGPWIEGSFYTQMVGSTLTPLTIEDLAFDTPLNPHYYDPTLQPIFQQTLLHSSLEISAKSGTDPIGNSLQNISNLLVAAAAPPQEQAYYPDSQARYPNGELKYVDKSGHAVNSSGQRVDNQGRSVYQDQNTNLPNGTSNPNYGEYLYFSYRPGDPSWNGWRFYFEDDPNFPSKNPNGPRTWSTGTLTPIMGDGAVTPVYDSQPKGMKQETYSNGQPKFVDKEGHSVDSNGYLVDRNGNVIRGNDGYPVHSPSFATDCVNDPASAYLGLTPVYCSSPLDKATYPNGTPTYQDGLGRPVNSSGQLVDDEGRPLYWDTPATDSPDQISHEAFFSYDREDEGFYYENTPKNQSHSGDTYTPMMGEGTITPAHPTLKIQTYSNGQDKYVDKNGKAVNSSGQLVDPTTGDPVDRKSDAAVAWSTGPFTPVLEPIMNPEKDAPLFDANAPDVWLNPFAYAGADIYSKSNLWLDVLANDDSYNNNNAIGFLLYTSNLAADGRFGDKGGNQFSEGLLAIQNSANPPKTLIAESVDITMEQMVVNGHYTPEEAEQAINNLFPGEDPVSVAARTEATAELGRLKTKTPTQADIEKEWSAFITDETTQATIKGARSGLYSQTIQDLSHNIYLAIVVLLVLLEALGITNNDIFGAISEQLSKGTDALNEIITEWNKAMDPENVGFESAEAAEDWMNELKELQTDMNAMPFDAATKRSFNAQFDTIFDQQAKDAAEHDLVTDPSGNIYYKTEGGYVKVGTPGVRTDSFVTSPLTIGDQAFGYTDKAQKPQFHQPDPKGLQTSLNAFKPQDINFDDPSKGGQCEQFKNINEALDSLLANFTSESSSVTTQIQLIMTKIEQYDNANKSTIDNLDSTLTTIGRNISPKA